MDGRELNDLIREAAGREPGEPDPYRIAKKVMDLITPVFYDEALECCLPARVREVIRHDRAEAIRRVKRETREAQDVVRYGRVLPAAESARRDRARWDAMREEASREMREFNERIEALLELADERVKVDGEWRFVGDLSPTELRSVAADHRRLSAENIARAEFWEQTADELDAMGATSIRSLRVMQEAA